MGNIWRAIRFIPEYRGRIAGIFAVGAVVGLIGTTIPYLFKHIVDVAAGVIAGRLTHAQAASALLWLVLGFVALRLGLVPVRRPAGQAVGRPVARYGQHFPPARLRQHDAPVDRLFREDPRRRDRRSLRHHPPDHHVAVHADRRRAGQLHPDDLHRRRAAVEGPGRGRDHGGGRHRQFRGVAAHGDRNRPLSPWLAAAVGPDDGAAGGDGHQYLDGAQLRRRERSQAALRRHPGRVAGDARHHAHAGMAREPWRST